MICGKTKSGFEFQLDDEVLDDYELLEILHKIDQGDNGLIIEMVDRLLGEKQRDRLKDHVRTTNGRVSAKRLLEEVMEIFKSSDSGKN